MALKASACTIMLLKSTKVQTPANCTCTVPLIDWLVCEYAVLHASTSESDTG